MDWIAIGLGLVTTGALVVYITRPWWAQRWNSQNKPDSTPDTSLTDQREAVLIALRDLDFDHVVGKLTEEDYAKLRQSLLVNAAAITTQMDNEQRSAVADLDARLDTEILAVRQKLNDGRVPHSPDEVSGACPTCNRMRLPGDLYCRGCGTQLAPACPECDKTVSPTDRFCMSCGFELALAIAG
jgi:hypothetical protein